MRLFLLIATALTFTTTACDNGSSSEDVETRTETFTGALGPNDAAYVDHAIPGLTQEDVTRGVDDYILDVDVLVKLPAKLQSRPGMTLDALVTVLNAATGEQIAQERVEVGTGFDAARAHLTLTLTERCLYTRACEAGFIVQLDFLDAPLGIVTYEIHSQTELTRPPRRFVDTKVMVPAWNPEHVDIINATTGAPTNPTRTAVPTAVSFPSRSAYPEYAVVPGGRTVINTRDTRDGASRSVLPASFDH